MYNNEVKGTKTAQLFSMQITNTKKSKTTVNSNRTEKQAKMEREKLK